MRTVRPSALLLVLGTLALLPLTGCLSISGRVGMATGLGDVADAVNAQQGTDFSGTTMTTGYGFGGEMYGILGFQLARTVGEQTSTGTTGTGTGTEQTMRVEQADTEVNLSYPMYQAAVFTLNPGLSLGMRTTTFQYARNGTVIAGDDGTAMILRPHVKAVTSMGDRLILSAGAGYEFAFLNDDLAGPGGVPFKSGTPGPQANVTLTYFFCSGCVGN